MYFRKPQQNYLFSSHQNFYCKKVPSKFFPTISAFPISYGLEFYAKKTRSSNYVRVLNLYRPCNCGISNCKCNILNFLEKLRSKTYAMTLFFPIIGCLRKSV